MQKVKSFLKSWEFFLIILLAVMCLMFKITDASRIAAGVQKKPIFYFANVLKSMRPYFLYSFMSAHILPSSSSAMARYML